MHINSDIIFTIEKLSMKPRGSGAFLLHENGQEGKSAACIAVQIRLADLHIRMIVAGVGASSGI